MSCVTFTVGISAIIVAYLTRNWAKKADPGNIRYGMAWLLSFIIVLTLIGPLKTFYGQLRAMSRGKESEDSEKN